MSSPLSLRRWVPVTHDHGGVHLEFEVRRPNALEAAPLRLAFARAALAISPLAEEADLLRRRLHEARLEAPEDLPREPGDGASADELASYASELEAYGAAHPEYMERLRALEAQARETSLRSVELEAQAGLVLDPALLADLYARYVRNVKGLDGDDGPVTTGAGLMDYADRHVTATVVGAVRGLCTLGAEEGKASASHSTSSQEPATHDGASGATSTASADGPSR